MTNPPTADFAIYACPACRGPLRLQDSTLFCQACSLAYPIIEGHPDFILEDLDRSPNSLLRWANRYYDRQARFYEWSRFPFRPLLYGGWGAPSLGTLVRISDDLLDVRAGLILDAACGPGTLGRRLATPSRAVYGIDVSVGMLRQGAVYVRREGVSNVHFARACIEGLPFPDNQFDAATCGAALQAFADPALALREIGRTLKPGAPIAVITLLAEQRGIFRYRYFRERLRQRGLHVFQLPQLEDYVEQAGLVGFEPHVFRSLIVFQARKPTQ